MVENHCIFWYGEFGKMKRNRCNAAITNIAVYFQHAHLQMAVSGDELRQLYPGLKLDWATIVKLAGPRD